MIINFLLNVFVLFFLDLWICKIVECKEDWLFTSCNKRRICSRFLIVQEQVYNKYVTCLQVNNFLMFSLGVIQIPWTLLGKMTYFLGVMHLGIKIRFILRRVNAWLGGPIWMLCQPIMPCGCHCNVHMCCFIGLKID